MPHRGGRHGATPRRPNRPRPGRAPARIASAARTWPVVLLLFALLLAAGPLRAGEDAGPELGFGGAGGLLGENLQIDGGVLDFIRDKNAAVIRNYAVLTIGPMTIRARNMVYYYETNEVYAEGSVSFQEPGGSAFVCDRLYFNTAERRGTALDVQVKAQRPPPEGVVRTPGLLETLPRGPRDRRARKSASRGGEEISRLVVRADEARSLTASHQELIGASVTASLFARPHWQITSKAVNLRQDEKVESWHNVLRVGKVPVLYIPYLLKDLKYDWPYVHVSGGRSEEWGAYVLTKWGFDLPHDEDAVFRAKKVYIDSEFRQHRGWATGLELDYETGRRRDSYGFLDLFYTRETLIGYDRDRERAMTKNELDQSYIRPGDPWRPKQYAEDDRWAIDWWHRQRLNERWDIRMEAHKYSDRDLRKEYFEQSYKEDKAPETSFDLRYTHPNVQAELVARKRLNDWQDQSEYLPELRFWVPGFRFGRLPVYFNNDTRIGFVNRRYDEAKERFGLLAAQPDVFRIKDNAETGTYFRAHTESRLYAPIRLGSVAMLTPYVGGRATYYEELYGTRGVVANDADHVNHALLWGGALSTRFFGHFRNNTWRHVVEPTIRFAANEDPNIAPGELLYIDEIENYDEVHFFTFALHQKLQRRRHGRVVDYLSFDIEVSYLPLEEEQKKYNFGNEFSDIRLDLVWRPTDTLVLFGSGLIDTRDAAFNRAIAGVDWRFRDTFRLYASHLWTRGSYYREPTAYDSSETTVAVRTRLWNRHSHYSLELAGTYQWAENAGVHDGFKEWRLTLYRDLDTFELGLSYFRDEMDDDHGFFVTLSPKGWVGYESNSSSLINATRASDSYYAHPTIAAELDAPGAPDDCVPCVSGDVYDQRYDLAPEAAVEPGDAE